MSAAHTARLTPEKLASVIHIENLGLLEQALGGGNGVVLLLAHMGNWEVLSRLIHFFPAGARAGAFYRPLRNRILDARVLAHRQADGTRMFSKRDNPLHVAGFLREGGIVGILADQRAGKQGEPVRFFGRLTRASPLPSLLARRSKSTVLALAVITEKPGKWIARFLPVAAPPTTEHCMVALEQAMKLAPVDVFWFQERWKVYTRKRRSIEDWLGPDCGCGSKPHRVLLWLPGTGESWRLPEEWTHPDLICEVALTPGRSLPSWLPSTTRVHEVSAVADCQSWRKTIVAIDESAVLPLDLILLPGTCKVLEQAGIREAIPVVSLP
jgi:KDO2-lipid IV(A) lauroyltransferase